MNVSPRLWLVVAGLVVLHFFLRLGLGLGGSAPDLLVVALLIGARDLEAGGAAGTGFFFGLLEDAFSSLAFGSNALALVLVGALGARTRDLFVGDSVAFLAWYFLVGKFSRDLIHWLAVGDGLREPFVQAILIDGVIAALYATVAGMVAFILSGARWEPPR